MGQDGSLKVVAVIQARMTSSRLPGKVLRPILGRPLLSLLLERLRRARMIDTLLVAMTVRAEDDPLQALCEAERVGWFRGHENDVLGRFEGAISAAAPDAAVVVRVTSDCPLLDPAIVDEQVCWFLERRGELDYASVGAAPRLPNGASVEVFTRAALARAHAETSEAYDREHVTPYLQRSGFRTGVTPVAMNAPDYRLSVDTPEDFALVSAVIAALYPGNPNFTLADVIAFLDANPQVKGLNANIVQTTGPYAPPKP